MITAMGAVRVRMAEPADAAAIAVIYNQGVEGREATFETEPRSGRNFAERIVAGTYPVFVAEPTGRVVGCAWISPYSDRACYAGVGECSVYVAAEAERRGFHKLLGKLFTTNVASVGLVRRCRFREVGVHRCHGRLDGDWRDVLLVERLLGDAASSCGD